jgi:uncharacterized protein
MKRFVLGLILSVWAVNLPAGAQAFNCNFAKQADELTICRDDSLKALDEQMAERFFKVRQGLPAVGKAELKSSQKAFLAQRNFCGTDGDCIDKAYQDRLEALCALANDYSVDCGSAGE